MSNRIQSLKIKTKLLQKAKKKKGTAVVFSEALHIVATNSGFKSWRDRKENLEANSDSAAWQRLIQKIKQHEKKGV